MKICEIENKKVKPSKCSLTIKDENGKTRGVVRDLTRFKDLQPNKAFLYFNTLKKAGIWGNNKIDLNNCYIQDNTVYYLRNMKSWNYYNELEKQEKNNFFENVEKNGITVIKCILC